LLKENIFLYEASVWYRFFDENFRIKDTKVGDFAELGVGFKNSSVGKKETTNFYSIFATLDITALKIRGGYDFKYFDDIGKSSGFFIQIGMSYRF
jgi:hypothetical protein